MATRVGVGMTSKSNNSTIELLRNEIETLRAENEILNVEKLPKLDDTTDSMAAAICHAHSARFSEKL